MPTGVLIDEQGIMVRHDEDAYSKVHSMGSFEFGNDRYRPVVLDWVANGADSVYVQSPEEVTAPLLGSTEDEAQADALFKLGVYFYQTESGCSSRSRFPPCISFGHKYICLACSPQPGERGAGK